MFYGWRMVGVAFASQFVSSGLGFYALGRLMKPLADEFTGGDLLGVSLLGAAMSLPGIIIGPLVGRAIARYPLRQVMPIGGLVLALGFALATQATELWHLLCVYAVALPFGIGTLSSIGPNTLVSNWFDRRRALVMGISQFGLSIAGAVAPFLITLTLIHGGWRNTYTWFAGISLVTALVLWWSITDRPADRGLYPDGDDAANPATTAAEAAPTITMREAFSGAQLWLIGIASGLCFSGTTALLQTMHPMVTNAGYAEVQADSVLALMAVGAALGKLFFGYLGVRLDERSAFVIAAAGQAACLAAIPSATASINVLLVLSFFFGLALGGVMPAMGALLARLYGPAQFALMMGYLSPILIPFQIVGAPAAAYIFDQTGSFDPAIYAFVVAALVAVAALLAIRIPKPTAAAATA